MPGTTTAECTSCKKEMMTGTHNFAAAGHTFKVALVKVSPTGTYGAATTNYSNLTGNSDEVANGNGYTTGGVTLTSADPAQSGTTAYGDFADVSWTSATFSTTGAIIYNASAGNKAVCVLDFGETKTVATGTITIVFPTADASDAIIRTT